MIRRGIMLSCLLTLLTGAIYLSVQALQKNNAGGPDFSGEWKSRESISMGGNIVCSYNPGDRMLAKTMKIAQHANFMTIETTSSSPGTAPVTAREKLTFDGKESEIHYGPQRGKKSTVRLSADRQTMTVNSMVHLMVQAPYHVDVQEQLQVYVTEVWNLSSDGRSITVQSHAKSGS